MVPFYLPPPLPFGEHGQAALAGKTPVPRLQHPPRNIATRPTLLVLYILYSWTIYMPDGFNVGLFL